MANVEIPVTNPHLSASAEMTDNSKTDESIQTSHTTVNVGPGGTIQQHCGNQKGEKEFTRIMSTFLILFISLLCDAFICVLIWQGQSNMRNSIIQKFDVFEKNAQVTHQRLEAQQQRMEQRHNEVIEQADTTHKEMMKKAKEGTIWLLRDDIIKSIDFHEATKKITPKQFKRLKDEFDYYASIGGNHDVKERFDDFTARIYGTGEVKMVNEIQLIQEAKK